VEKETGYRGMTLQEPRTEPGRKRRADAKDAGAGSHTTNAQRGRQKKGKVVADVRLHAGIPRKGPRDAPVDQHSAAPAFEGNKGGERVERGAKATAAASFDKLLRVTFSA
jgi:hypothetical protein